MTVTVRNGRFVFSPSFRWSSGGPNYCMHMSIGLMNGFACTSLINENHRSCSPRPGTIYNRPGRDVETVNSGVPCVRKSIYRIEIKSLFISSFLCTDSRYKWATCSQMASRAKENASDIFSNCIIINSLLIKRSFIAHNYSESILSIGSKTELNRSGTK